MSPVCGASWAKTEDICYKLITVADAELAEVTQAANEVDYATAKVKFHWIENYQLIRHKTKVNIEGILRGPGNKRYASWTKDHSNL